MAYTRNNNSQQDSRQPAAGFLNVVIVDDKGNEHRMRRGIPLYEDNVLERSLLNSKKELKLTASVHVSVDADSVDDIAL